MISEKINTAINGQINAEMYSSYLYLSMATWFAEKSLSGFATWMRAQAQEEMFHAMKMLDYVLERGGHVEYAAIDQPECNWSTPLEVMEETANHEAKVTGLINDLVDLALDERDHAANIFLQWFVAEQVEEEASVGEIVDRMKMIGDGSQGLFAMDMEMGKRVYTQPTDE
ncbi:ferritin [Desulfomarina profundi]|uniref:Ferritin n=1 Tax=Desulfomarina profundi TaxID=2772557 RepID=A0A8D5JQJ4_9BACT|nr:ferritin [Desulfomarina profundi]BCL60096.1 ferritin [Desulfomarina profundi]